MSVIILGVISNLFTRDEQQEIISELTPIMKRENPKRTLTHENVMEFFLFRTCQNLHVVFCFSPVSSITLFVYLFFKGKKNQRSCAWWPYAILPTVIQPKIFEQLVDYIQMKLFFLVMCQRNYKIEKLLKKGNSNKWNKSIILFCFILLNSIDFPFILGWWKIPQQSSQISSPCLWLHHRLVPAMA